MANSPAPFHRVLWHVVMPVGIVAALAGAVAGFAVRKAERQPGSPSGIGPSHRR